MLSDTSVWDILDRATRAVVQLGPLAGITDADAGQSAWKPRAVTLGTVSRGDIALTADHC